MRALLIRQRSRFLLSNPSGSPEHRWTQRRVPALISSIRNIKERFFEEKFRCHY
ncbi:uncharacterized protein A4U43_C08F20400, partial [Asparagus officinalis]